MTIAMQDVQLALSHGSLQVDLWEIEPGQHWMIFSAYQHYGSLLGQLLSGERMPDGGDITGLPERVGVVSLAQQQALLDAELEQDETDYIDQIDYGHSVEYLIGECCRDSDQVEQLLEMLDLEHLRNSGFRQLSTGETRRLMLARALAVDPQLLVLDDPYVGLDVVHQEKLSALLSNLSEQMTLVLITARESHIPDCITHIAMFSETSATERAGNANVMTLSPGMTVAEFTSHPVLRQLEALSAERSDAVMALIRERQQLFQQAYQTQLTHALSQEQPQQGHAPLVAIRDGKVEYFDRLIFDQVNWQILPGQHWQIRGPNGCGKSTLLALILGDHPQCYANDMTVLGYRRGSGESIWDIKRRIGVVSSSLHMQYRVSCSALEVLLSGFYDSIGLYDQPSKTQVQQAREWLAILAMADEERTPFRALGYGQQRLLLIGRALIKQPALLILDEPYQGLDFVNRKLVYQVLNMIAEEQLSQLLYVSHHPEDSLPAIRNYVDFVPDGEGYAVVVSG
ncbi:ATP-binding cassette domain-containing protein [Photobacterium atrarenae]|uniref:ATP-binding cassette domain-containing protein n=1 Tax=Photobacterium atrarenae TaxID=865757 RepID=A0ABY5GNQ6_9GAMM|nr:ATP-binding cassette domain-containing protein [Photobacterium atrarenae]UTV30445.1 ATP-binding cassette domain-containing protein [Photobacterium atrarenae]